jgi:hypothetical protein
MKELKVMQCIEDGVEGSKNYGTLKGLNISGFNTAKPGTSSSREKK